MRQSFGVRGPGVGSGSQPTSVAALPSGLLAVLDPSLGEVVIVSSSGAPVHEWQIGKSGTEHGPQLVADGNSLWLTDPGSKRLLHVAISGHQRAAYTASGLQSPGALALGSGVIVVSDAGSAQLVEFQAPPGD